MVSADDMHGGSCIFVRREAFLSIGGFTELRRVASRTMSFMCVAIYKACSGTYCPSLTYRYRTGSPKSVSKSTRRFENLARVAKCMNGTYEDRVSNSCRLPWQRPAGR